MSILSSVLRQVYALSCIKEGYDVIVNSDEHAQKFQAAYRRLEEIGWIKPSCPHLSDQTAAYLAMATGSVQIVAAGALALNWAPKTAGLILTGLSIPITAVRTFSK